MKSSDMPSDWVVAGEGVRRRILSHSPEMMLVEFEFQKGAEGALHSHPHLLGTYVAEGDFQFSIDGHEQSITQGQSMVIPSNAVHGCVATTRGRLIDTFTPRRDDFL